MGDKAAKIGNSDDEVVLIIAANSLDCLKIERFDSFGLQPKSIHVLFYAQQPTEEQWREIPYPVVTILGLGHETEQNLTDVRQRFPHTSIMIAADRGQLKDVYPFLSLGAVDVVTGIDGAQDKILMRIGAHRSRAASSSRRVGRLTINLLQRTVSNGNESANLTPIEVKIITTLADSVGSVVEREEMKQKCWGDEKISDNALNRKIYEVRRTLRKLSESVNIRTIYGLGFELNVEARG